MLTVSVEVSGRNSFRPSVLHFADNKRKAIRDTRCFLRHIEFERGMRRHKITLGLYNDAIESTHGKYTGKKNKRERTTWYKVGQSELITQLKLLVHALEMAAYHKIWRHLGQLNVCIKNLISIACICKYNFRPCVLEI